MNMTEFRALAESATPGHWAVYPQPVANADQAKAELSALVDGTPEAGATLYMLSTPNGLAPAITGIGKDSAANAAFIAACSPTNMLALLDHVAALEAQTAAVDAQDAARYRWLADRDRERFSSVSIDFGPLNRETGSAKYRQHRVVWHDEERGWIDASGDGLDAAIDAAIAGQEQRLL